MLAICGLLALSVVAGWLLLHVPAGFALTLLRDRIDPLAIQGAQGSLWKGSARRTWWGDTAMGGMQWQVDPRVAWRGVLSAQLHFELPKNQLVQAHIRQRSSRLEVDALHAQLLGSALQRFFTAQQLHPIGALQLDVEHAVFDGGVPVLMRGHAIWRQATLAGPRVPIFLGDLRADFRGDRAGLVTGTINDLGGPIRVAGWMRMDAAGYRIRMQFAARDPRLFTSLAQFGEATGDGGRAIELRAIWWWKTAHG